ncbi:MAG: DUF6130 family protein [Bacteroidales bacterium]|jgi:predicted extracellular nuclease|nr:DUF6130 family protein [Bacteroidales bacterium]
MKKITLFFLSAFLLCFTGLKAQVIISQIYEGSSYNKFIEITNIGTSAVDLTSPQLTIKTYNNKAEIGANNPTYTRNLTGTLAPGQCLIIRHKDAASPAYAVSYTPGDTAMVANFNGQGSDATNTDIVTLNNGTTLLDVFAWGTFQYANKSYYRNLAITAPNSTWTLSEWTETTTAVVDGAATETIERLGYHGAVSTDPVISILYPADGSTVYTADIDVTFSLFNFIMNTDGHIHYTVDGGSVNEYTLTDPISITGLTNGAHKVVMTLVDNSHNPLTPNVADSTTFTVNLSGPTITPIYDIQYTTLPNGDSPLNDSVLTTTGIVTATHALGYFIQDGTDPWNGLYVYDNSHSPALGDSIVLTGLVSEYNNLTELKTITYFNTPATGKPLPTPVSLTTTTVKTEQYEGMLVNVIDAPCTYVHTSGWWEVIQNSDTLEIGNLIFGFPTAVVGSYYDVTGVVYFTWGDFVLEPRDINDITLHSSIEENTGNYFSIYPNPVSDVINIKTEKKINKITVINLLGEKVFEYNVTEQNSKIFVTNLQNGIYFLSFMNGNTIEGTRTFIKQ